MARGGIKEFVEFVEELGFTDAFIQTPKAQPPGAASDPYAEAAIDWLLNHRPKDQAYWPALTMAMLAQVEFALSDAGMESIHDVLDVNIVQRHTPAGKPRRQLAVQLPGRKQVTIRPYYNRADRVIRFELRRAHPSSPGHATSSWVAFSDYLTLIGKSTRAGRRRVAEFLWDDCIMPLHEVVSGAGRPRQPRPFLELIENLETGSGSTGGAIYQGIVFGYLSADSPTLTVVSHSVNTGSSRAGAVGDVDGYLGEDLVLAAEVKDKKLDKKERTDLVAFVDDISQFPNADAVIFTREIQDNVRTWLEGEGVRIVTHADLIRTVTLWDVPKQENAIRAMRFYLGAIQQSPDLLNRVRTFVESLAAVAPSGDAAEEDE